MLVFFGVTISFILVHNQLDRKITFLPQCHACQKHLKQYTWLQVKEKIIGIEL